jgi:hypothetical protein
MAQRPVRLAYQPAVLFSHNKPATSNQPAVLFSHNKPAPAISHQPTEQAASIGSCCITQTSGHESSLEVEQNPVVACQYDAFYA